MASKIKQIVGGVIAGLAIIAVMRVAGLVGGDGGLSKDKWCTYKIEKDALSIEANKNPDFVAPERGLDTGWMERRAAWIEPKIAELQLRHFKTMEAAQEAIVIQASEQWNCHR